MNRFLSYTFFGHDRKKNCSVERYNPETNTWTKIADMANRRSGAGVGVVDEKLYAIGMYDFTTEKMFIL